jgi:hypothetical protein
MAQLVLAVLLVTAGLGLGYRLWIRPWPGLGLQAQAVLGLILLSLLGGLFGAPAWWVDDEGAFSWDLPPLASRMLAAAGISFVVASLFALTNPTRERLQLHLVMLATYLAPLVWATLLFHIDRFDFDRTIVWAFFGIAGTMTVACIWFLVRTPNVLAVEPPRIETTAITQGWLTMASVVTLAWGILLFATDDGGELFGDALPFVTDTGISRLIWVWPGDLLSSRLIGVMLLAIGASAGYRRHSADAARMMLGTIATYGLLVAAANLWGLTLAAPVREGYVIVFTILGLGSAGIYFFDPASKQEPLPVKSVNSY